VTRHANGYKFHVNGYKFSVQVCVPNIENDINT
jgi:hypothetical protein